MLLKAPCAKNPACHFLCRCVSVALNNPEPHGPGSPFAIGGNLSPHETSQAEYMASQPLRAGRHALQQFQAQRRGPVEAVMWISFFV